MFDKIKVDAVGQNKLDASVFHFQTLVGRLEELMPAGRELSIVKTKLEEASFFASRGIALANEVK